MSRPVAIHLLVQSHKWLNRSIHLVKFSQICFEPCTFECIGRGCRIHTDLVPMPQIVLTRKCRGHRLQVVLTRWKSRTFTLQRFDQVVSSQRTVDILDICQRGRWVVNESFDDVDLLVVVPNFVHEPLAVHILVAVFTKMLARLSVFVTLIITVCNWMVDSFYSGILIKWGLLLQRGSVCDVWEQPQLLVDWEVQIAVHVITSRLMGIFMISPSSASLKHLHITHIALKSQENSTD